MTHRTIIAFLALLLFTVDGNAQFTQCTDANDREELIRSQCASVNAQLDYNPDSNASINLFVRKFPAIKKRQGSMWLIAGGPGESGASFYPLIELFSQTFPHLDILIPDHRGTGLSGKICPKEESIDSTNGIALGNDEWGSCFGQMYSNTSYVKAFSITNAAKDLRFLMNTLSGDGKRYVYGVSYGTQLILRLLQLENTNIDGVILDSLVPLQDDDEYDLSHRSYVVNHVGNSVLSHFDGLTNTNKTTLAAQLKNSIQKAKEDPSFAKKLPKQALSILMGMMLDIPEVRATIPAVIGGLSNNNFEPLNKSIAQIQKFYTNYGSGFKTLPSSIPLVQVISASENNLRPTLKPEEVVKESEDLIFTSNLAKLLAENAMPTYKADAYFGKVPKKMPPMLIFHGTLDPKTHITGAIRHIEKLPKENIVRLIKVKDAPHFIALFAPKSFTRITSKFMRGKRIKNQTVRDANTLLK